MEKRTRCYLIDDRPEALELLAGLLCGMPEVTVVGMETDGQRAELFLAENYRDIDLLFLETELPGLSGLELARRHAADMGTVFVTGHPQYGEAAYELGVLDYLVKPLTRHKLATAMQRIARALDMRRRYLAPGVPEHYYVPGTGKGERIRLASADMVYMEGLANYTRIHLTEGREVTTYMLLKEMEELLSRPAFVRIHRSYIISTSKVDRFNSTDVHMVGGKEIPFGGNYREGFLGALRQAGLMR